MKVLILNKYFIKYILMRKAWIVKTQIKLLPPVYDTLV